MKQLVGSRYSLPDDGRPACKLDDGDVVRVALRGFFKGNMSVGARRVACVFLRPVGDEPWVYCSKGRFLDVVKWVESRGLDFHTEFSVEYARGSLNPMTDADLVRAVDTRRMAVEVTYGPFQGSA